MTVLSHQSKDQGHQAICYQAINTLFFSPCYILGTLIDIPLWSCEFILFAVSDCQLKYRRLHDSLVYGQSNYTAFQLFGKSIV